MSPADALIFLSCIVFGSVVITWTVFNRVCLRSSNPLLQHKVLVVWGIITILYFFFGRWLWNIIEWIRYDPNSFNSEYTWSLNVSKVLLLDMCPFLSLALPVVNIFDKRKQVSKFFAVMAIFSGSITLYAIKYVSDVELSFAYIMIGNIPNRLYFLLHFNIVLYGIMTLLFHYKQFKITDFSFVIYYGAAYLFYAYVMKLIFNVQWNVTGLVLNDWIINSNGVEGEYYNTGVVLKTSFPNVYGLVILGYAIAVWFIMYLHNLKWWVIFFIVYHQKTNYSERFIFMEEEYRSPIYDLVECDNKHLMHWEGELSAKVFFKAYWTRAWNQASIWNKLFFVSHFVFVVFFVSIVFQFFFKKTFCFGRKLWWFCQKKFYAKWTKSNLANKIKHHKMFKHKK